MPEMQAERCSPAASAIRGHSKRAVLVILELRKSRDKIRRGEMATKDPREPFTRLSVAEAKEKIESGSVQVIDARTPVEYAGGDVPGGINNPHILVVSRKGELDREKG